MRWSIEQVAAVAPGPSAMLRAESVADPARWGGAGADDRALWGRCGGSVAEPYEVSVDHVDAVWRCSCPARVSPCKHVLGLLAMWARGQVADAARPERIASWIARRDRRRGDAPSAGAAPGGPPSGSDVGPGAEGDGGDRSDAAPDPEVPPGAAAGGDASGGGHDEGSRDDHERARDDRVARMRAGLVELDRWLEDRLRTGLADPALARYATWDELAARLVDARAGALANRVRRMAGMVGVGADWHERLLAELGVLHLLVQGALRVPDLPVELADQVASTSGWQVRQADVLAGVPETDDWEVLGRSDTREDRIEVRRWWLRGRASGSWAMVLSFAAYRQSLDASFSVGTVVRADLHRYPGGALRALVGARHGDPVPSGEPVAVGVVDACDEIGDALAAAPWLERLAVTVRAQPSVAEGGRWVLTDDQGSLPLDATPEQLGVLVGATAGRDRAITVEWTPSGLVPLAVHLADRSLDVARVADAGFVGSEAR